MTHDDPVAVARGDEGAMLLLVLFVTTALAVLIGVVLTSVEVNLRNNSVVRNLDDKTYAADGGVEYVIQRLRQDPDACRDPNLSPWQQNNTTVTVSCTPLPGAAGFGSGWAVITRDGGPASLSTVSGTVTSGVNGPTYVAGGLDLPSPLSVFNGPLLQASPPCSGTPQPSSQLGASAAACTTAPVGVAEPALPCLASCAPGTTQYRFADRGAGPAYTVSTSDGIGCKIFLPGRYTAAPALGPHNYFASGVYYLENVGTIDVSGLDLIGGKRGTSEVTLVDQPACAGDEQAGVSDGTGVEWILGGTSVISVGSGSGTTFELFARRPGTSAAEGADGIAIRSVPTGVAGYVSSTTDIFSNGGGSNTQVAVHGLVYAPDAAIQVSATAAHGAELSGGVVASTLNLNANAVSPGTHGIVSAASPSDGHQFITISSTAEGGATKDVTTTAVIELTNDSARTVVVDSWVTNAA